MSPVVSLISHTVCKMHLTYPDVADAPVGEEVPALVLLVLDNLAGVSAAAAVERGGGEGSCVIGDVAILLEERGLVDVIGVVE